MHVAPFRIWNAHTQTDSSEKYLQIIMIWSSYFCSFFFLSFSSIKSHLIRPKPFWGHSHITILLCVCCFKCPNICAPRNFPCDYTHFSCTHSHSVACSGSGTRPALKFNFSYKLATKSRTIVQWYSVGNRKEKKKMFFFLFFFYFIILNNLIYRRRRV